MRSSWDSYFIEFARHAATRATCDRAHVGTILVMDRQILATGYNGSIRGLAHCDDVGHLMDGGHCVRTVHAEANAIASAARRGVCVDGATAYVTHYPCLNCFKLLANAGIVRIVYDSIYRPNDNVESFAEELNIPLDHFID